MQTNDISIVHTFVDEHRDKARAWFANEWSETHRLPVGNKPPFLWANEVAITEVLLVLTNIKLESALASDRIAGASHYENVSESSDADDRSIMEIDSHIGEPEVDGRIDDAPHLTEEEIRKNKAREEEEFAISQARYRELANQEGFVELQRTLYPTDMTKWI